MLVMLSLMMTVFSAQQNVQMEQTPHCVLVTKECGSVGRDGSQQTNSGTSEIFQNFNKSFLSIVSSGHL